MFLHLAAAFISSTREKWHVVFGNVEHSSADSIWQRVFVLREAVGHSFGALSYIYIYVYFSEPVQTCNHICNMSCMQTLFHVWKPRRHFHMYTKNIQPSKSSHPWSIWVTEPWDWHRKTLCLPMVVATLNSRCKGSWWTGVVRMWSSFQGFCCNTLLQFATWAVGAKPLFVDD